MAELLLKLDHLVLLKIQATELTIR